MAGEPVVEFYIQNYKMNDSFHSEETLFQTVPFTGDPVINNPKVKNEIGKAGSFEFEMEMTSPYYDSMLQMKTMMRVVYFGNTIFRGRVLTIDRKLSRTRTVHCEGDFAFFLDSHQVATEEKNRSKITVKAYLEEILSQHNTDCANEPIKQFTLGEVPDHYTEAVSEEQKVEVPSEKALQKFGDSSWNTSMDRLDGLVGDFGGYFRTRYDAQNGIAYLDWFDKYYNEEINTQTIEVSKNLIDLSGPTEVENIFTIVVPIGKSGDKEIYISDYWPIADSSHAKVKYMTVPELASIPLYTDAELDTTFHRKLDYLSAIDRFGYIWKVKNFDNANTSEKLFAYCKDWIKKNFMPEITQWEVTALDMKVLDSTNQVLLCGDRVNVVHPEIDQTYPGMTAISAEYDLFNPEKNKYTIGIPNSQINLPYGVSNSSGSSSSGISEDTGGDSGQHEAEHDLAVMKEYLIGRYSYKSDYGEEILQDNALAFVMYNTDGTEREKSDVVKDAVEVADKLNKTKVTKRSELIEEAARRGVSIDDTQLLIDFTPEVKTQQTRYKSSAENYYVNTIGLTVQQAEVLLNETAGQSWLANLTDENGEWTDYAYTQGVAIWRDSESMKDQSIKTKNILNGEETTERGSDITNIANDVFGINMDVGGGFLTTDFDLSQFNLGENGNLISAQIDETVSGLKEKAVNLLGDLGNFSSEEKEKTSGTGTWDEKVTDFLGGLFHGNNTESGGKEVEIESDTVDIDGTENGGTMGIGAGGLDGWRITLNRPITYVSGGTTFTVPPGSVASDDFHIKDSYDSLKAKLIVVDVLLADYAEVGTLAAMKATIDTITSDRVTVDNYLSAAHVHCTELVASSNVYAGSHIYIEDTDGHDQDVGKCFDSALFTVNNVGDFILTLGRANGTTSSTPTLDLDDSTKFMTLKTDFTTLKGVVDNITASTITAGTNVSAANLRCTNLYAESHLYIQDTDSANQDVGKCFTSASFAESNGTITLTLGRANGSTAATPSFNIAATAKYIADVAAARVNGRSDGWSDVFVHDISIGIGESETYNLKYTDPDTGNEMNTGETFTVTVDDVSNDDIQIGSYASSSSGTLARSMKAAILQAIDEETYFSFVVSVQGTSATRRYYMDFGS